MKQKFWTGEKLLSFSALLISLLTLSVFIYQTNLIRKQQYLSVYPYLGLANGGSHTLHYEFFLANNGIGPAFIKSIKITANGKDYEDIIDYVMDVRVPEDSTYFFHSNIRKGRLISAGEEIEIIKLMNEEETKASGYPPNTLKGSKKLFEILNHKDLDIEIVYESIYGESWTIRNREDSPIKN